MKRVLLVPEDGKINWDGQAILRIFLGSLDPGRMALELALIREKFVDALTIRRPVHSPAVRLRVGSVEGRAAVTVCSSRRIEVILSSEELDHWLAFFLRYYRDELAEVDHLDVEASSPGQGGGIVDVIVSVAGAAPPVSPEEARRRLGVVASG